MDDIKRVLLIPAFRKIQLREGSSQVTLVLKNSLDNARDTGDVGLIPGSRRSPGGGRCQPTLVFLLEKFHGQEEPGGLRSMGSQRVRHNWMIEHTHTHTQLREDIFGLTYLASAFFPITVFVDGWPRRDLICCVVIQFPLTIQSHSREKNAHLTPLAAKIQFYEHWCKAEEKKRFIGQIWKIIWKQVSYDICYNRAIIIHFQESRGFFFLSLRKGVFAIYICLRALISIGNEKHISGEKSKASVLSHHPEVSQNITPSLLLDLKRSHSENILRTSSVYICTRTLSQFSAHSSRIGNYRAEVTRFSRPPHSHLIPHHFSVRASGTKSGLNSGKEQNFISYPWAVSTLKSRDAEKK